MEDLLSRIILMGLVMLGFLLWGEYIGKAIARDFKDASDETKEAVISTLSGGV